jgi:CRISPR-associated Cas5-like protein
MVTAIPTSVGTKTANLTVTTAAGSAAIPLTVTAIYPVPVVTSISPSSGFSAGGTYVTISGANLSGVTAVKFASTNAHGIAPGSATQLIATSPAGVVGQTVDITVTTLGGTSATSSADLFSYTLQYQAQNQSTNPYTPYSTLEGAISAALAGAEIRAYAGQFDGVFSLTKDIILNGGYNDIFDAKGSLPTTLNGSLTVDGGTAKLDSVTVKGVLTVKGGSLLVNGVAVVP